MNTNSQEALRSTLHGQRVLIVGGDRREQSLERLQSELKLAAVVHCPTRKSDASPRRFEARLREPGFVLVVWVLGLSRTHHGTFLHRICRELGLPWIDCSRIPHPSMLLAQIERLRIADALVRRRSQISGVAPLVHWAGGVA